MGGRISASIQNTKETELIEIESVKTNAYHKRISYILVNKISGFKYLYV